ncbi:MAG: phage tail tube protein [bacterium]
MGALRTRRAVVAAKLEADEGTAETLTLAEAAVEAENVALSFEMPFAPRPGVSSSFSRFKGSAGGPRIGTLTFDLQLSGSGTAGTAPAWSQFLEACGMLLADSANSDIYTPSSISGSYTVGAYFDGVRYLLTGCRGSASFEFNAGEPAKAHIKLMGVWSTTTDTAPLAPNYDQVTPVSNCGGAFTYDNFGLKYKSLTIELNHRLTPRPVVSATYPNGALSVAITDRECKGTVDPEMELVATYDFFTKHKTNNAGAFSLVIGGTAGNILTVTAPAMQIAGLSTGDRDGLHTLPLDLYLARSADTGEDELSLAFT